MSSTHDTDTRLRYQPYSSILNPGFWQQLTDIKLNKLKLSTDPVDIIGSYASNLSETLPCLASFDQNSFNAQVVTGNQSSSPLYGQIVCTNVMQEFLDFNKKEFLDKQGGDIWHSISNGRALTDPEQHLSRFGLLVYADLKKYNFYYWFSFPAVNYPKSAYVTNGQQSHVPISNLINDSALKMLQDELDKPFKARHFSMAYFIVKHYINVSTALEEVAVFPLTQYSEAIQSKDNEREINVYFAFNDPSASRIYPGWPLRNFLALISTSFHLSTVKIIRIRRGRQELLRSSYIVGVSFLSEDCHTSPNPLITGWEKNESHQLAPRRVNLSKILDPRKLAEDAVNLNLRLMKWRLMPDLDLDKIAATRCLLLGCGTLGCHIARGLLAWGVKNISILDNGKISYSNPVRQTLYNFEDCANSASSFKAKVAAESLKKIHPSINVEAYTFTIPMPGHHVVEGEVEKTKQDVSTLERLIEEHDAIFLLMDTRESRWLPTVIAMSRQKLVINAAIGFDTFLLQRYGIRNYSEINKEPDPCSKDTASTLGDQKLASENLGCYFCNDIVAPGDSTLDRTLDQQCTVSRPGVSMMVSAMAVELLASIVSSRMGALTPAPVDFQNNLSYQDGEDVGSELGIVPHSIRGNLARYYTYMPTSPSFNKCSACSPAVVNEYLKNGFSFLQQVFDDPSYLEEIAGLKDLQNVSDNVWALESDEDAEDYDCQEVRCSKLE